MRQDEDLPPPRVAVAIEVPHDVVELVADRLFTLGASAVAEQDGPPGRTTLVADLDPDGLESLQAGPDVEAWGATAPRVLEPDAAWNQGWRDWAKAWRCGPRLVLRPEWVAPDPSWVDGLADGSLVEVVIEPGAAFGSGSHATTRLCAAELDHIVAAGARVLDVGCGTGVLGVAALLLGAGSVTAIDIDPEARRVTAEVAVRNGVRDRLEVLDLPLERVGGQFDLVLANLLLPIIEDLGADLVARVAPGGHLLASGVLVEQQARVESALRPLRLTGTTTDEGWMTLVFLRP